MFSFRLETFSPSLFLRTHFSGTGVLIACFFVALLNKILLSWIYTDLEGDKSLYLLFAESLLQGHPLVEPVGIINNASAYLYNPGSVSPLYSYLCVPFLWLTDSFSATSLLADICSWTLFFSGLVKVSRIIYREQWITNLLLLSIGFFLYPHQLDSAPKDTLAIGLILWSVYFARGFVSNLRLSYAGGTILALWLLGLTKYSYVPLIFVSFCLLLFLCWQFKQKRAAYGLVVCCVFLIAIPYYWFFVPHSGTVIQPQLMGDGTTIVRGFFPSNLSHRFPFVCSVIINTNFWGVQMADIFNTNFSTITRIFQALDVLLLSSLCGFFIWIFKPRSLPPALTYCLCLGIVITLQLCLISITNREVSYKGSGNTYTYIQEGRAFFFPILALQLLFFFLLFKTYSLAKGLKNFLFLLFMIECLHGAYFSVKQIANSSAVIAALKTNTPVKKLTTELLDLSQRVGPLGLVTSNNHLRRYALLHDIITYPVIHGACPNPDLEKSGYIIATHLEDSGIVARCFSKSNLTALDTLTPFVLNG
ncbi:MAG: hypothetical protein WKF70_08210, partial [Chitinophagaceae bacterium]